MRVHERYSGVRPSIVSIPGEGRIRARFRDVHRSEVPADLSKGKLSQRITEIGRLFSIGRRTEAIDKADSIVMAGEKEPGLTKVLFANLFHKGNIDHQVLEFLGNALSTPKEMAEVLDSLLGLCASERSEKRKNDLLFAVVHISESLLNPKKFSKRELEEAGPLKLDNLYAMLIFSSAEIEALMSPAVQLARLVERTEDKELAEKLLIIRFDFFDQIQGASSQSASFQVTERKLSFVAALDASLVSILGPEVLKRTDRIQVGEEIGPQYGV